MDQRISDVAFSESVKQEQIARDSRLKVTQGEESGQWRNEIDDELRAYVARQDSFYFATANAAGQPYIQHRGGPPGFLTVLDKSSLAFADFAGNEQYITIGNLKENDRAYIFLMDYYNRRRIKIWGSAEMLEASAVPEMMKKLTDPGYSARPQRIIVFKLSAWTTNCPQHITRRFTEQQIAPAVNKLHRRIAELEAEVAKLKK
jgi:predicted pyridoxine 5'-phosphate oxidase superfamily flavin-nucleotide-binding protein